ADIAFMTFLSRIQLILSLYSVSMVVNFVCTRGCCSFVQIVSAMEVMRGLLICQPKFLLQWNYMYCICSLKCIDNSHRNFLEERVFAFFSSFSPFNTTNV